MAASSSSAEIEDHERWDIIGEFCNKTLKLKADRWLKAVQIPETRTAVLNVFDNDCDQVSLSFNSRIRKLEGHFDS